MRQQRIHEAHGRIARAVGVGSAMSILAMGSALASPASAAVTLHCGELITQTTTLAADVGPCAGGPGILVGADNITLSLAGHKVVGDADKGAAGVFPGIVLEGRTGVTIKGYGKASIVRDFEAGVGITGGSGNRVSGLTVRDNIGPLDRTGDFGDGIAIVSSPNNVVNDNRISHNGPYDGVGVFGTPSISNRIVNNNIDFNEILSFNNNTFSNRDDGINLGLGIEGISSHTTISGNTITLSGNDGINACSSTGAPCISTDNVIVSNTIRLNGFGSIDGRGINLIVIGPGDNPSIPTHNLVKTNEISNNFGAGIFVASLENVVLRNHVVHNGSFNFQGTVVNQGLDLTDLNDNCDANVWQGNVFVTFDRPCTTKGGTQVAPAPPTVVPQRLIDDLFKQLGISSASAPVTAGGGSAPPAAAAKVSDLLRSGPQSSSALRP